MEWYWALAYLFGTIIVLIMAGVPVAFAFILANLAGVMVFMRGAGGLLQLFDNATDTLSSFTLVPVPLFILMGGLFFNAGLAERVFRGVDVILGRLPGRLSYLTVAGGTAFAALTGSSMANTAMLGSLMIPEMIRRGYKPKLAIGPILGTGGLAIVIPPSAPAVILGSLANIDIGALLIAGIGPGLVLALMFVFVIWLQVRLDPEAAPAYDVAAPSFGEKLRIFVGSIMPMLFVIGLVVGLILFGLATPTESAAFGVLGVLVLGLAYRTLTWRGLIESVEQSVLVSGMALLIIVGSVGFSQLVVYSGANAGMLKWALSFDLPPLMILTVMLLVLVALGMFMDLLSMMMLTVPLFFPLALQLGIDPILFGVMVLITLELGLITPPFGTSLFIMRGIAPPGTTMAQVIRAGFPYIVCDVLLLALLVALPGIALYLPSLMQQ
jgi:tripartite ATP-independent transporter DctM subunit